MKIKNEKELLELFVAKDFPARFTRPFLNEYYAPQVWATNSHMRKCLLNWLNSLKQRIKEE